MAAMYEVNVEHSFKAQHAVKFPDGRYETPHAHQWHVTATYRADRLDENGMAIDFVLIQEALKAISHELEGSNLNAIPEFFDRGATAETLSEFLAKRLQARLRERPLYRLNVTESPGCNASFYPNGA